MHLFHGLQQELADFRMKIAADQDLGFGPDTLHIVGWNDPLDIHGALRQCHASEIRENPCKGLRHWKTHRPHVGISQKRLDGGRLRHADNPNGVDLPFCESLVCSRSGEWQECSGFGSHAAFTQDLFGRVPCGASLRSNGNAFSFELCELIELLVRRIKNPERLFVDGSERQYSRRMFGIGKAAGDESNLDIGIWILQEFEVFYSTSRLAKL